MKAIAILLAPLLTGTARAQSIAIPDHTYEVAEGYATENILANGKRWLLIHGQDGLGIQLQPGLPVTTSFPPTLCSLAMAMDPFSSQS
jgi:hypothetical protein